MPKKSWKLPKALEGFKSRTTRRGSASGKAVLTEDSSSSAAEPSTSDTSATVTETSENSTKNLWSTLFAETMPTPSTTLTVLTLSPNGYAESGFPNLTEPDRKALSATVLSKLELLAEGRGETIDDTVREIAQFYIENEDNMVWLPLSEGIPFYFDNVYIG